MRCMVSFLFNEAQPGLEASSDLGIRSYKGSGFLYQTLPSRGVLFLYVPKLQVLSKFFLKGERIPGSDPPVSPYLLIPVPAHHQGKTWLLFRDRNGRQ